MRGEASLPSAEPCLCRKTFAFTRIYQHLPTSTAPFRHFSASKFNVKLHAPKSCQNVRKMLPHGPQKGATIAQQSNFIAQAGTNDFAAVYYTLATFVPPGTDGNIAQDASQNRTIYQRPFLQNLLQN